MGFTSNVTLDITPDRIQAISTAIDSEFALRGYKIDRKNLLSGATVVSLEKGGFLMAVIAMKNMLQVNIYEENGKVVVKTSTGFWGLLILPVIIGCFFFLWPLWVTAIIGCVRQYRLNKHLMEIVRLTVSDESTFVAESACADDAKFCSQCGSPVTANFCSNCGAKVE